MTNNHRKNTVRGSKATDRKNGLVPWLSAMTVLTKRSLRFLILSCDGYKGKFCLTPAVFILLFFWPVISNARPVRIAYPGISIGAMVPALAAEKKLFQQEGIQMELIVMPASTGIMAMGAGDIDFSTASSSALAASLRGLPVKIVMFYVNRPYHAIVAQKGIKSIQDLRGKTIATSRRGGAAYYVPRAILEHHGMNPDKDVRLISVGGGDIVERLQQLEKGRFEATVLSPPLLFYAEEKGFRIVGTATDFLESPQQGIAVAKSKIESTPDEVNRMIRVFLRALRFIRENREETVNFMRRWLRIEERVAEKSYNMVLKTFSWDGEASQKGIEKLVEITKQEGKLTKETPLTELIDFDLLRAVRAKMP